MPKAWMHGERMLYSQYRSVNIFLGSLFRLIGNLDRFVSAFLMEISCGVTVAIQQVNFRYSRGNSSVNDLANWVRDGFLWENF